jgi:DNA gyrase subunit B
LIEEGKVFIAESPLFEITSSDGKTFFAYNEKEKNDYLKTVTKKVSIQRSKGLGENDPDMMWQTTMCPATRRLIRVTTDDVFETQSMFEILLGDDLTGRKDFIEENGELYLEMLDLS